MNSLELNLKKREVFGKKTRSLVEEGQILGNIQGKGKDSVAVQGDKKTVTKIIEQAGKSTPIELKVDGGEDELVLVSEVDRDHKSQELHHVTFQVVVKGQKVTAEVPIRKIGGAPAEQNGNILVTVLDHIEVEAIPSNLPEALEIDISSLSEPNDSVTLEDIKLPEGVELKTEENHTVARVEAPRVEEEPEEEGEEADAADVPSEHGHDEESEGEESGEESSEDKKEE